MFITTQDIFNRIAIRAPYFALEDLKLDDDNVLSANIPVQQPLDMEVGPIVAAEVGRHLAILGSCAASLSNPRGRKHYYLAYSASLKRSQPNIRDNRSYLRGTATGNLVDKRTAQATAELKTSNGESVYLLSVNYHVIPEAVFGRLFSKFKIPTDNFDDGNNPHSATYPITDIRIQDIKLTASLGEIQPLYCVGHFPAFPAMPIAILMGTLSRCAGYLLKYIMKRDSLLYVVEEALVQADNLAFAKEIVDLEITYLHTSYNEHFFRCCAVANSKKNVGEMVLKLKELI
jgi:hypothetical protein